jgi:hypothetical protein
MAEVVFQGWRTVADHWEINDPADISFDRLLDSLPNVDRCVAFQIALCCAYQITKNE